MKLTQRLSLRVRLTLIFLILVSITWAIPVCGLEKDDG